MLGPVKFMFSKKATKIVEIFTIDLTLCSKCQINGEDYFNLCGLLRKHELILKSQNQTRIKIFNASMISQNKKKSLKLKEYSFKNHFSPLCQYGIGLGQQVTFVFPKGQTSEQHSAAAGII